jgi:DnaJ homolog subfamily C member 17
MEEDPYDVLGVAPLAPDAVVRRAYRRLALVLHPDKVRSRRRKEKKEVTDADDAAAEAGFRRLQDAYTLLSDPEKRREVDAKISARLAQEARFAAMDSGRKRLREKLEAREREAREAKRMRGEGGPDDTSGRAEDTPELTRIREQNRVALESARRVDTSGARRGSKKSDPLAVPDSDLGTVVVAKWRNGETPVTREDLELAFGGDGAVEFLVITPGRKHGKAMVGFATSREAQAAFERRVVIGGITIKTRWAPGHEPTKRAAGADHSSSGPSAEVAYRAISAVELEEFASRVAGRVASLDDNLDTTAGEL